MISLSLVSLKNSCYLLFHNFLVLFSKDFFSPKSIKVIKKTDQGGLYINDIWLSFI